MLKVSYFKNLFKQLLLKIFPESQLLSVEDYCVQISLHHPRSGNHKYLNFLKKTQFKKYVCDQTLNGEPQAATPFFTHFHLILPNPYKSLIMLGLLTMASEHLLVCFSTHHQAFILSFNSPSSSISLLPKSRLCFAHKPDDFRWLRHNIKQH